MSQPALSNPLPAPSPAVQLAVARVSLVEGPRHSVTYEDGTSTIVRRAASCLLTVSAGDRVLVAVAAGGFILAVLERDGETAAEIAVDGNARLHARGGTLELRGDGGIGIATKGKLSLTSELLLVANARTELVSKALDAVAVRARASFDDAGLLAKTYDVVAERIAQRADRVYRFVSEIDRLRAGHFDHRAEHSAQIRGENTVMVARQVAKIDGEQIHVG